MWICVSGWVGGLLSAGDKRDVEMQMSCYCCTWVLEDVCSSSFAMAMEDTDDAV